MSIILFIIILGVLIFVHELGHFLVAKKSGIRVDEFAVGFPPKLFSFEKGGTKYSLNLIPFGGYVKIYGENSEEKSVDPDAKDSFVNKSPLIQGGVLVAGVVFNMIFAWFLFLIVLMAGSPTAITADNYERVRDPFVTITNVQDGSPAQNAGIKAGDKILAIDNSEIKYSHPEITVENVQQSIAGANNSVLIEISRGGEIMEINVTPQIGLNDSENPVIGIALDKIGISSATFLQAIPESFTVFIKMTELISVSLFKFLGQAFTGQASIDDVAGPVGIVGLVDDASKLGIVYLLTFTAIISINLAILNILPLPALDGGRLVIVIIEAIIRRKINGNVVGWINGVGFLLLILLMIIITVNDIGKLF
jgi:regulator of sigma E protease